MGLGRCILAEGAEGKKFQGQKWLGKFKEQWEGQRGCMSGWKSGEKEVRRQSRADLRGHASPV